MQLTTRLAGDALIVRIEETRIDAAAAVAFKDAVIAAARTAPDRIVLDLERVQFIDSSGLGAIIAVMKLLAPERRLDLADLAPIVAKVFRLTRMDSVFAIHVDADAAVSAHAR